MPSHAYSSCLQVQVHETMAPAFSRPCPPDTPAHHGDAIRHVEALGGRPGSSSDARWPGGWPDPNSYGSVARPPPLFQRPRPEDTLPVGADLPRPQFVRKRRHILPHQAMMVMGSRRMCKVCGTRTKKCCSACSDCDIKHYYCTRQCQQEDWPQHREICGAPRVLTE